MFRRKALRNEVGSQSPEEMIRSAHAVLKEIKNHKRTLKRVAY